MTVNDHQSQIQQTSNSPHQTTSKAVASLRETFTLTSHTNNLRWSVRSQPLICPADNNTWPKPGWFRQYPTVGDIHPEEVQPGKLGRYFEAMIGAWIDREPDIECLAANLPVRDGGRTLGEFDLIVDYLGVTEHWEVAVKFYLAMGDTKNIAHWFGPNPSDTLRDKYQRLMTHQLQLLRYRQARQLLASRGWRVTQTRCLMKGRLFYPYKDQDGTNLTLAPEINPDHERGWWIEEHESSALLSTNAIRFVVLPKQHWLATLDGTQSLVAFGLETLLETVAQHSAGTLHIARIDQDTGIEIDRGFIVKQQWRQDVRKLLD